MALRVFPVASGLNPINTFTNIALNGFANYARNALSSYGQSSTHVSSSGSVFGGRGGTFDGGANGSVLSALLSPLVGSNGFDSSVREVDQALSIPSSAGAVSRSSLPPSAVDYINAELASAYGMSKSTAYQEALSNTAYQRAVKDMKVAGLNPAVLFGSGHGSGANSGIYASESSSRSGGFGSSSAKGKLFDSSTYSALSAIGGLVGIALTGKPDGFWIGSQTTQGAMGLMNAAASAINK